MDSGKYKGILAKVLFWVVNLALLPCTYFCQLSKGLDPSWVFALNDINTKEGKFGKDYFFTYGPLGFLSRCQNVGNNLTIGIVFWVLVAVIQVYLFAKLFRRLRLPQNLGAVIMAAAFVLLASTVEEADLYLCYLYLLAMLLVYQYNDFGSRLAVLFFSGVIFLFKFSGFILLAATLAVLVACMVLEKRQPRAILFWVCAGLAGPLCYLAYHPSARSLFRYCKAAFEISSGYQVHMSLEEYKAYLVWVVLLVACYCCLMLYGAMHKKQGWTVFLILAPACFVWYKEGFVRNDQHYRLALVGILLVGSLLLFFVDWKEWLAGTKNGFFSKLPVYACCMFLAIPAAGRGQTLSASLQAAASNVFQTPKRIDDCRMQELSALQEHNKAFMDIIGMDTYTTFPWEITENSSYENQNFRISPLLQNYTVYTPYLDRLNAEFYVKEDAPEYIILYLSTIDERLPLIEAPKTWEQIYQNYSVADADGEKFLLKKRAHVLEKEETVSHTQTYGINDVVEIPEGCNFIKWDLCLGLKGTMEKLLYKVLPVEMKVEYADGSVKEGRVVTDNLSEGIELDSLVIGNEGFLAYMQCGGGGQKGSPVVRITLTGNGTRQYQQKMEVTFGQRIWKPHTASRMK